MSGQPVRIDNIARMIRGFGPTRLSRSNRQYAINLNADVAPGYALDKASDDVRALVASVQMDPGYSVRMQGQTRHLDDTTGNLLMSVGLACGFEYMVLCAQ